VNFLRQFVGLLEVADFGQLVAVVSVSFLNHVAGPPERSVSRKVAPCSRQPFGGVLRSAQAVVRFL
jgi:hypothetical protein